MAGALLYSEAYEVCQQGVEEGKLIMLRELVEKGLIEVEDAVKIEKMK